MKNKEYGISIVIKGEVFSLQEALSYMDKRRGEWTWFYTYEHGCLVENPVKIREVISSLVSSLGPGTKVLPYYDAGKASGVFPGPRE